METLNTVLFIGKPGSGKGTQAALLSEATGWKAIASGDLFRALIKEDTHVAHRMREEHEKGYLAPDWFATYFFQKSILPVPLEEGIIFDGFGRKVSEAEVVIAVLEWLQRPFTAVHIKVSDEEIVSRLQKRGETSGRADDFNVEKRLEEYRTHTEPSVEVFRSAGKLIEVDGMGTPEEIAAEIKKQLGIS